MDYNSDMLTFLYYTDKLNPAHYNFTAVYMWNNANYTDKCYTNTHTYCTSTCQLQSKILCSSFYYRQASPLQHQVKLKSGTVPGKDLSMHHVKMHAVS